MFLVKDGASCRRVLEVCQQSLFITTLWDGNKNQHFKIQLWLVYSGDIRLVSPYCINTMKIRLRGDNIQLYILNEYRPYAVSLCKWGHFEQAKPPLECC